MNTPTEKLPSVWELLDERDLIRKQLQDQALQYLSLDTQNQLLYEENQKLKGIKHELLEALQMFVDVYETDDAPSWMRVRNQARTVIAKATGDTECARARNEAQPVARVLAVAVDGTPLRDSRGVEWLAAVDPGTTLYSATDLAALRAEVEALRQALRGLLDGGMCYQREHWPEVVAARAALAARQEAP